MKIQFNFCRQGEGKWITSIIEFKRLPEMNEFVMMEDDGHWYKIIIVLHCIYETEYDARIFAREVESTEEIRRALKSCN
jgi:hypothetical protein